MRDGIPNMLLRQDEVPVVKRAGGGARADVRARAASIMSFCPLLCCFLTWFLSSGAVCDTGGGRGELR